MGRIHVSQGELCGPREGGGSLGFCPAERLGRPALGRWFAAARCQPPESQKPGLSRPGLNDLFSIEVVIESLRTSHYPPRSSATEWAADWKNQGAERMRRFAFMEAQVATLLDDR